MFLKIYFSNLFLSISDINFYKHLKKSKLSAVLLFFIISFVFLGIWLSAEIILRDYQELQAEFEKTLAQISASYPDDVKASVNMNLDIRKVLPFVLVPIYLLFVLFNTLIDSLIAFLFIKIFYKFDFKYLFKINLHIAVIAGLIERMSSSLYAQSHYPLYSLSFWLILVFVLFNLKKTST